MKKLLSTLGIGLLLLYFLDSAFQIDSLNEEMLVDNLARFLLGFIIMINWHWSKQKRKFKIAVYIIFIFLIGDLIFDYVENISTIDIEMLLHDLYFFVWGAISGYFFITYLHCKKLIDD